MGIPKKTFVNVARQSDENLIKCPVGCTIDNLALANENALSIAIHWPKQNI
jgi:hypothetical protein